MKGKWKKSLIVRGLNLCWLESVEDAFARIGNPCVPFHISYFRFHIYPPSPSSISLYWIPSISASHEASMMLVETPMVP